MSPGVARDLRRFAWLSLGDDAECDARYKYLKAKWYLMNHRERGKFRARLRRILGQ